MTDNTFVYTNPNTIDGDSYEVAKAACDQTAAVADLMYTACNDVFKMARLAEMQRELDEDKECDAAAFPKTPLGKKIIETQEMALKIKREFISISRAAAYNPNDIGEE